MKHIFFTLLVVSSAQLLQAQNVAINGSGAVPDASAMLDVSSTTSGILIPRVTTAQRTAIASPATGLKVYDITTSCFWFFNGTVWVMELTASNGWALTGNTLAGTEFMGSVNAQDVKFYSSNIERMRIFSDGRVAVNSTSTFLGSTFYSAGTGNNDAIDANISGSGVAVYGQSSGSGTAVYGLNGGTGNGVRGSAAAASSFGMRATNSIGSGILASGEGAGGNYLPAGSGGSFTGLLTGLVANTTNAAGTGMRICGQGVSSYPSLVGGSGGAFAGTNTGVYGIANNAAVNTAGGYFTNGNSSYAYVGFTTAGGVAQKINGPGAVSTIVKNANNQLVNLYCPESPEVLFQDFGTGVLVNGVAHINMDETFTKNISVNDKHPLRVIIQLEGDCKGVFVSNKTNTGFDVKEIQGGHSNITFTWFVSANRADAYNEDGSLFSKFEDVRFGEAPAAAKQLNSEAKAVDVKKEVKLK